MTRLTLQHRAVIEHNVGATDPFVVGGLRLPVARVAYQPYVEQSAAGQNETDAGRHRQRQHNVTVGGHEALLVPRAACQRLRPGRGRLEVSRHLVETAERQLRQDTGRHWPDTKS